MSFQGDVYQAVEVELKLTRETIKILMRNGLTFTILTKGGLNAVRDFSLLQSYPKSSFGSTIVCINQKMAKENGIKTWVSLEPVIDASEALRVICELHDIVDHWKIGMLNHLPHISHHIKWRTFTLQARELLESYNADYYFKKDLQEFLR